jgi:integrase
MNSPVQDLPKKALPERIHRELRKGETIYHSMLPCHVSSKHPEGKWVAQVRREDNGKLTKYPVKGFGTPRDALDYVKSLRPDARGHVSTARPGEPTLTELYEFVKTHRQKRLSENSRDKKEIRWRLYIEPEWGDRPISQITRRNAQEWITEVEESILASEAGTLGLSQFEKVRTDLHFLFECLPSFSSDYEDRKNPFADLDFISPPPRVKVTIESQFFGAIAHACNELTAEGLCTEWIVEIFQTSLLSGLREGEVMALCADQLDFKNGAIIVDRAVRRDAREIDPITRVEVGPVLRQAINLPKGGTPTNNKTRIVPMCDQLAAILQRVCARERPSHGAWDLLWPGETGKLREQTRFRTAWTTLRERLNEIALYAPLIHESGQWPAVPKRQGWPRNIVVDAARRNASLRLPNIFKNIDFRDTRNSFASYMNEIGLSQATREHILGHGGGLTNAVYTVVTSGAHQDARRRLTAGWLTAADGRKMSATRHAAPQPA